jgi:hypothetical protein
MELLAGLFFNSIWLIVSFLFGFLLCWLFTFVPWPAWLEIGIILALSFWVGMMGMVIAIEKMSGKRWRQCFKAASLLFHLLGPTAAACVVAVMCYLITSRFTSDSVIQEVIVGTITFAFWGITMTLIIENLKKEVEKREGQIKYGSGQKP